MAAAGADWSKVRELFDAAIDLPVAAREAFVLARSSGEPELAREVLALLAAHAVEDGFLLSPSRGVPPQRLGAFELGEVLGRGGMGTVYAAMQDSPRRQVALKVLHAGSLTTPAELERFRREADVLARLHHPGIAQVHAAGSAETAAGTVAWMAMELVAGGRPLTRWAEERQLDRTGRVELLVQACEAVEHAHRAGVVHRDLKPGNLLVGDDGRLRVIDFGIARISGAERAANANFTAPGDLLGTLAYMSPEQARGDAGAVDERSDVHALGVIAYELLTGRRPFTVDGKPLPDALRTLIEEPPASAPELDADLRAICWQAMARLPRDRYASAAALGEDLRRWLRHELVAARPPRLRDLWRMWRARHGAALVAAAVVAVVLVGAAIVSMRYAVVAAARADEAEAARRVAAAEGRAVEQALGVLVHAVGTANPFRQASAPTVYQLLDGVADRLARGEFEPAVQVRLHTALAGSYRGIGRLDRARAHATAGLAALDAAGGATPLERAELLMLLGVAGAEARDFAAAEAALTEALGLLERHAKADDPRLLGACARLAGVQMLRGAAADADRLLQRAMAAAPAMGGRGAAEFAEALANLGSLEWSRGREESAAQLWRRALDGFRDALWEDHPLVAQVKSNYGLHLQAQSDFAGAEAMFIGARDLFARWRGADSPDVANAELKLAFLHVDQGDLPRAAAAAEQALRIRRAWFGGDANEVPGALQALGYVRLQAADWNGAIAACAEAVELRSGGLPPAHPELASARLLLGRAFVGAGRLEDAEPHLRAAVAAREQAFGAGHWRAATARSALGECLLLQGQLAGAGELLRGSLAGIEGALPPGHPEVLAAQRRCALLAERQAQAAEAPASRR
jgi:tetratricopeptide (TPR) repeat protein